MGKSPRNRNRGPAKPRVDPTGISHILNGSHDDQEEPTEQSAAAAGNFLAGIAEELQQLSSARRQAAAVKFSSWLSELSAIAPDQQINLNQDELAPIITHLLVHLSESSVTERFAMINAVSLLSSISSDVCEDLVRRDTLTPIIGCLELYGPDAIKQSKWTVATKSILKSVSTITSLCSCSPTAVETIMRNSQFVFNFLIECLSHSYDMNPPAPVSASKDKQKDQPKEESAEGKDQAESEAMETEQLQPILQNLNYAIGIEAAKCLEVLIEDQKLDPSLVEQSIKSLDAILTESKSSESAPLTISAVQRTHLWTLCAILRMHFVCSVPGVSLAEIEQCRSLIISLTAQTLRYNSRPAIESLLDIIRKDEENDLIYQLIRNISAAKQSALEGLCNALTPDDQDEEEPEDFEADDMECDAPEENGGGLIKSCAPIPLALVNHIVSEKVFQEILASMLILPSESKKVFENHFVGKMVLGLIADERERCCAAISTLLSVLPVNYLENDGFLPALAAKINDLCKSLNAANNGGSGSTASTQQQLSQTGELFRAISSAASLSQISFASIGLDVTALCALAATVITFPSQSLPFATRCNAIHALAKVSSKPDAPLSFVEECSKYLVGILDAWSTAPPAEVPLEKLSLVGEIFDSLMDIFSGDGLEINQVFTGLGLLPKLRDMAPKFSQQVKFYVRKRELTRNSPLSDINRNLSRFISYKTTTVIPTTQ